MHMVPIVQGRVVQTCWGRTAAAALAYLLLASCAITHPTILMCGPWHVLSYGLLPNSGGCTSTKVSVLWCYFPLRCRGFHRDEIFLVAFSKRQGELRHTFW